MPDRDQDTLLPHDNSSMYTAESLETPWNTGLCECCGVSPMSLQFLACCCPCVLFARINTILPETSERHDTCDCRGQSETTNTLSYCLLDSLPYTITNAVAFLACGCPFVYCPMSCIIHSKMRETIRLQHPQRPLQGSTCCDIIITCLLPCCALLQEYAQIVPHQRPEDMTLNSMPQ